MAVEIHVVKEWDAPDDDFTSWGDIKVKMYEFITDVLVEKLGSYCEDEDNHREVIGGNEFIEWYVYDCDGNAYKIEETIYWDGSHKVEIHGVVKDEDS